MLTQHQKVTFLDVDARQSRRGTYCRRGTSRPNIVVRKRWSSCYLSRIARRIVNDGASMESL